MNAAQEGLRKVAILVTSLETRAADAVLDQMDPRRAAQVRQMIMDLDEVDPEEQKQIIDEFYRLGMRHAKHDAGVELDEGLARRMRGPSPARKSTSSNDSGPRVFAALEDAEADKLAAVLAVERPQTIAVVLAHVTSEQAGAVLARLRPVTQVDVLRRLVDLEETDEETLRELEAALAARLSQQVQMQRRRVAGFSAVSGILQSCAGPIGSQILENLNAYDRGLAERFAPPPVDYEDLADLDDASLAAVFRAAGEELTQLALIGAEPRLLARLTRRLPVEQAAALKEAIEFPGVIRLSDVEEAREEIAKIAQRMAGQGQIRLPRHRMMDAAA